MGDRKAGEISISHILHVLALLHGSKDRQLYNTYIYTYMYAKKSENLVERMYIQSCVLLL